MTDKQMKIVEYDPCDPRCLAGVRKVVEYLNKTNPKTADAVHNAFLVQESATDVLADMRRHNDFEDLVNIVKSRAGEWPACADRLHRLERAFELELHQRRGSALDRAVEALVEGYKEYGNVDQLDLLVRHVVSCWAAERKA